MRKPRGFLSRAIAAALVIWLGLVIAEPLPLDACPMHGSHAMHGLHSMHGPAHGTHAQHHASPRGAPKKGSNQCTCIGDCTVVGGSIAAAIPTASPGVAPRIVRVVDPAYAPALLAGPRLREHALPPSNGPPRIS